MRRTRLGFTLMELMIVIGIMLLLAALTIPVIGMIRKQAKEALCRNNLKQIGIGITAFQLDNNNRFPANIGTMFAASQPLASENPRVSLCPFDTKKGTDSFMGRPPSWNPSLIELYLPPSAATPGPPAMPALLGSSYIFEAADTTLNTQAVTWDFENGQPDLWGDDGRKTWADAKVYQLKHGNTNAKPYRMSDFPILRCFWHSTWPIDATAAKEKRVLNLAWDMSLFWSIPKWEDQVKAP